MVKVHKLVAAIATTITLSTTSAYALNMGEISWKSSYGQPLNARIELSDAAGLKATDIKPNLASPDDFAKSGLDRSSELANLTFKTIIGENGKGYIQISSARPIKEPYLNFLLDVNWQGNKISREYTILMDLPAAGKTNTAKPAASQVSTPKPISPTAVTAGETYSTVRGDTLWSVAEKVSNKAAVAKTATAIYKKNPKAFINGSANHLLADYTLKLPTPQEVNAISVAEATTLLQSTKATTTTKTEVTATQPTVVNNKQTEQLQTQLDDSKQALDNARQENDELSTQLEQLQSEISRLEELSKQKDSQIEEVKTKLEQPTAKPVKTEQTTTDEEAAKKAADEAAAQKAAQEAAAKKAANEAAAQKAAQEAAAKKAADEAAAQKPVQQPTPPVNQDTTAEPSFISSLLGNQLLLMAGGGVLLVLCVVALLLKRRKAANDDSTVVDLSNVTLDDDDLNDSEVDTAAISSTDSQPSTSPLSQLGEGMGIVDKADIYLAYNHYDEAKELLVNALQDDPTNTEYRLKLMEVYAEQGDVGNFETEEQELMLLDPLAQHKIDSLKEKYPTLASAQFNFSSSATPSAVEESSPQFTGFETPETDDVDTSAVSTEQTFDYKEPEPTEVSFDYNAPSTPVTEVPEITQEVAEPEVEKEIIYEPDPTREVDESFELEKITPDATELEKPMFGTNLDDDENFSSDSPIFDFEKEEAPQEEPKEEEFKFDLGFNSASEPPLEIDLPQTTSAETADELDDVIEKDQVTTKLELVHAYLDMGDTEGAHDLLEEIIREGNESQQAEAKALLASINGNDNSPSQAMDDVTTTVDIPVPQEVVKNEEPTISLIDPTVDVDTKTSLAELDLGFEFPPEDEVSTKLELANAYIEMGDANGAKDILEEVLKEGSTEQKQQAEQLLASLN